MTWDGLKRILIVTATAGLLAACATGQPTAPPVEPDPEPEVVQPTTPPAVVTPPVEAGPIPGSTEDLVAAAGADRVFFAFDSSELTGLARRTLDRQAGWLRQYSDVNVTIEGHADERGTREYNLALGDRRANAAKNYLVALGISANRIDTISYGKERPVDGRSNEEAWALNRRSVTTLDNAAGS